VNIIAPFSSIENKVFDDHTDLKKYKLSNYIDHAFSNVKILNTHLKNLGYKESINVLHSKDDLTTGSHHSDLLLETGIKSGLKIKLHDISPSGHITWEPKKVLDIIRDNS